MNAPQWFTDPPSGTPWRALVVALVVVFGLLVAGTLAIDAALEWRTTQENPRYARLPGTCYFAGDARNYMRIAINGYTNYTSWLGPFHFTYLTDRSWWPLFPNAVDLAIRLGGGMCSTRTVNGIAFLALVPLFQALTGERRWWRLVVVAALPFGAWLYVGEADSFFLALSAALVWICRQGGRWPVRAGLGALVAGALVGLAKPNALTLVPALAAWATILAVQHARAAPVGGRSRWRHALDNANPGWAPLLGALGIGLANAWWLYQTSGTYPFYVVMVQRTLWWREFDAGSAASFARVFRGAVEFARAGQINMNELQRLVELAAIVFVLALCVAGFPPRWAGSRRSAIPFHWRIGILSTLLLMFLSGQSHSIERYTVSNVFVELAWHRLVFGTPDRPGGWRLTTFSGLVRWTWLGLGPVLWALSFLLLGWQPLGS
jgi:hypothetical protein